ncbi:hypothetical protein HHI36_000243 [Cryptolaemus montrouzieri]|uniref:Uncharacterized protein n=1 Tax=Cryptolaemus montrouzieri TaxID=559131 RepID=A0ABD2P4Q5_9CUCU
MKLMKRHLIKAREKVGRTKINKEDKQNISSKALMELRKKLLNNGERGTIEYVELNRRIRKMIKVLNNVTPHNNFENNQGVEEKDHEKITQLVEEFYRDIYTSEIQPDNNQQESLKRKIANVNSEELPDIEDYEMENAPSSLKNNKAPGLDSILHKC